MLCLMRHQFREMPHWIGEVSLHPIQRRRILAVPFHRTFLVLLKVCCDDGQWIHYGSDANDVVHHIYPDRSSLRSS
jgi:hypothetical protein